MNKSKLIHGDALVKMREMPDAAFRLVVTSPPYNILNSTGGGLRPTRQANSKWPAAQLRSGYQGFEDNMPREEYVGFHRATLSEMLRLVSDDGAVFYNHRPRVQNGLIEDCSEIVAGLPVRQIIIWQRNGGINFNDGYFLPNYEVIYLIAKANFKLAAKANAVGCVWKMPHETANEHPAPFPIELPFRCITSCNQDGNRRVLDPFMGSGTTALAAVAAGWDWCGIEQSADYIEMAERRLKGHPPRIRDGGTPSLFDGLEAGP